MKATYYYFLVLIIFLAGTLKMSFISTFQITTEI